MDKHTVYAITNTETNEFFLQGTGNCLTRWRPFPKFTPYVIRRWAQRKLNLIKQSNSMTNPDHLAIVPVSVNLLEEK